MEQHIIDLLKWILQEDLCNSEWGIIQDNDMPLHLLLGVEHCDVPCRNFIWLCRPAEDLEDVPTNWALCLRDRYDGKYAYILYPYKPANNLWNK